MKKLNPIKLIPTFKDYSFEKEISKEEFRKSIEDNTLLQYLNKIKVNKGDVFFIKAGTVHAISKGIVRFNKIQILHTESMIMTEQIKTVTKDLYILNWQ